MSGLMFCFGDGANGSNEHIDPKTFMANERTFISWLHMAVTLGSIATALVALGEAESSTLGATQIMASALILTSIGFCGYSMKVFFSRNKTIRRREDLQGFDDFYGPLTVTIMLSIAWACMFALGLVKLASNDSVHAAVKGYLHSLHR